MTAADVKWSLDRAVTAKSLAPPQLSTGSLTSADQFTVVDAHTVTVTLDKPDRLALANLCVRYAIMINSTLAKQHATAADPWAQEWLKTNTAASGAYIVESHKPGESTIMRRNEAWKGGADGAAVLPPRHHPDGAGARHPRQPGRARRRRPVHRPGGQRHADAWSKSAKAKVASIPQNNGFTHITMNTRWRRSTT